MFFSKKPPVPGPAASSVASHKPASAAPPYTRPVKESLPADFVDTLTLQIDTEISDFKSVPAGRYWPFEVNGISSLTAESFAVLSTGDAHGILFVSNDSFGTHPHFELVRRLRAKGLHLDRTQRATREIIKAIHAKHAAEIKATDRGADTFSELASWELIDSAVMKGASDIHIQTRGSLAQIYFRIHGERVEQANISKDTAIAICNTLYTVHGDADSKGAQWDPKQVQGTVIDRECADGTKVQLRFSSRPIHPSGNVKAVMRVLVMDAKAGKPLEVVGYSDAQIEVIEEMLSGAQGMVLLVGPTNSGKSTSMQAMIQRIYERRGDGISIDTLEQPVEYIMEKACQTGVPEKRKGVDDATTGSPFTMFLKGFLQQDPDVIMFGEVRSVESAEAIKDFVLSGRKLLTTLHVYEAMASFARLRELGVPESVLLMQGFISGIVYQRLVRILCPHCAVPVQTAYAKGEIRQNVYERVMRVADFSRDTVKTKGPGCEHCNDSGIVGRTPCAEIVVPTRAMLNHLIAGNNVAARREWQNNTRLNNGGLGVSAVAHAIVKMRLGMLDPRDIETQIGPLVLEQGEITHSVLSNDSGFAERDLPPALRRAN